MVYVKIEIIICIFIVPAKGYTVPASAEDWTEIEDYVGLCDLQNI